LSKAAEPGSARFLFPILHPATGFFSRFFLPTGMPLTPAASHRFRGRKNLLSVIVSLILKKWPKMARFFEEKDLDPRIAYNNFLLLPAFRTRQPLEKTRMFLDPAEHAGSFGTCLAIRE
jgi:hypothetical protein